MKKLLNILFLVLSVTLMAQVPQGFTYQAIATDNNGLELVSQAISVKASVLSGSANGTVEWEETHATSTDDFGLFTLTIGQGTNTTNGAQTTFADISWGANTHFLKIEMDVTGGTNYSFMGTNQMMSVPYALYAESSGLDDDISGLQMQIDSLNNIVNVEEVSSEGFQNYFLSGTDTVTLNAEANKSIIITGSISASTYQCSCSLYITDENNNLITNDGLMKSGGIYHNRSPGGVLNTGFLTTPSPSNSYGLNNIGTHFYLYIEFSQSMLIKIFINSYNCENYGGNISIQH